MTDRHSWNSTLAAPTSELKRTPIGRHTRLRNRGGSMFPLTDDDKAQWKWMYPMTPERGPCDGCAVWGYLMRCHLLARGNGGRVIDNIVLLDIGCHERQEKRTALYEAEMDVDLHAIAAAHTAQWRKETGRE